MFCSSQSVFFTSSLILFVQSIPIWARVKIGMYLYILWAEKTLRMINMTLIKCPIRKIYNDYHCIHDLLPPLSPSMFVQINNYIQLWNPLCLVLYDCGVFAFFLCSIFLFFLFFPYHVYFEVLLGYYCIYVCSVASPGFVVKRGKKWKCVMGHSRWTLAPSAAAPQRLIVLWPMQYWPKDLQVVDICIG